MRRTGAEHRPGVGGRAVKEDICVPVCQTQKKHVTLKETERTCFFRSKMLQDNMAGVRKHAVQVIFSIQSGCIQQPPPMRSTFFKKCFLCARIKN